MTAEEFWSKIKVHFLKMGDVQKQGELLKIRKKVISTRTLWNNQF